MSDYETIQKRRSLGVGLFVLLGLCALTWLVFKFGDMPSAVTQWRSFQIFVQFPSAPGVQKDTPVRFCGYQVGRVTHVMPPSRRAEIQDGEPMGPMYHQTVVLISIDKRYVDIPSNSQVKLMTRGLGSSYIEIKAPHLEPNESPVGFLHQGIWVQGATGTASEFFPEETQRKLEELVEGFELFIANANDIIGDPNNKQHISMTLKNLVQASQETANTLQQAQETLAGATAAIEEYRELASVSKQTIQHVDAKMEQLSVTMLNTSEEIGKAASQLCQSLEKVNSGDGTLGRLVNDGQFYEKLLETTQQLDLLIDEIRLSFESINEKGLRKVWTKGAK